MSDKEKQQTIEEAFEELDALAAKLEDRETSLEDSFDLYKKGMELLKNCSQKLDTVEKKMLQMNEDGSGFRPWCRAPRCSPRPPRSHNRRSRPAPRSQFFRPP